VLLTTGQELLLGLAREVLPTRSGACLSCVTIRVGMSQQVIPDATLAEPFAEHHRHQVDLDKMTFVALRTVNLYVVIR
jgi:hypothetical protein